MEKSINLIVHGGVAHADDVFATAILRIAFGQVTVQRTRDPVVLRESAGAPDTFLLDVGGRYDPQLRLFDHHQPEGAGFRNPNAKEWPYATAGLVWLHYGAMAVRKLHPTMCEDSIAEVVQHIDDTVLKYVDAVDCGVHLRAAGPSLSVILGSFNPTWMEEHQDAFPLMLDLAQVMLTNFVKRHAGKVLARDIVRGATPMLDGQVLLLEACIPWTNVVAEEMPNVLLVVYPVLDMEKQKKNWQLRVAHNADKSLRIRLPECWAGRDSRALARLCGEEQAIFCHRSRHLAGASTLEGAMSMAEAAIREQNEEAVFQAA